VRFAPSPTGYLHVGGARTALFNWLFARSTGGKFILRIEDTDAERNRPELVEGILDGLKWLGLDWDEGPVFQSGRTALYAAAVEKLLASGAAYFCNCPPEKYAGGDAAEPGEAAAQGAPRRVVRCACRERSGDGRAAASAGKAASEGEVVSRGAAVSASDVVPRGETSAVRFRVPLAQTTQFDDAVFGPREISNDEIEDFVLLRSPRAGQQQGLPTYQLCAVVDDVEMRITHVIRGADHLSNTPKQVLLYRALGAAVPIFAHVPLILGPDRTRLSKRHGATSVGSYRDEGFLSEAFANFLALLGWSPGDDSEFLRTPELLRRFSLAGVSRTNAVFDRPKLEWFNQQYLQKLPIEELLPIVEAELRRAAIWSPDWAEGGTSREWFARTVDLLRPRTRLLPNFSHWGRAFFSDTFEYDPAARAKFWKDQRVPSLLARLADALAALTDWNHDACDAALRQLAESEGVKAGLLINAARVSIVGQAVAPPLFETMLVLGQPRVVTRLRNSLPAAVESVAAQPAP
jgi:glutamyl-tRNA synthetase